MANSNRSADTDVGAFTRRMEEQAYSGYREWPIFLTLREAQLKQLLTVPPPPAALSATAETVTEEAAKEFKYG